MNGQDALKAAAFEILEDGLFVFLEDTEDEVVDPIRYTMTILNGAQRVSEIGISTSPDLSRRLAANLLGTSPEEVTADERGGAVAEALNMVAGVVLLHLYGGDVELELCPPVAGGNPAGDQVTFASDGGTVQLWHCA